MYRSIRGRAPAQNLLVDASVDAPIWSCTEGMTASRPSPWSESTIKPPKHRIEQAKSPKDDVPDLQRVFTSLQKTPHQKSQQK